jgi:hypothetical protein
VARLAQEKDARKVAVKCLLLRTTSRSVAWVDGAPVGTFRAEEEQDHQRTGDCQPGGTKEGRPKTLDERDYRRYAIPDAVEATDATPSPEPLSTKPDRR